MPRIPKIAQRKAAETMPKKTESRIRIPLVTMTDHWIPAHPQVCDRKRDQKKYDSGKKRHVEPNHRKDYGQSRTHPCQYDRVGAACLEISHTVSFTVNL